MKIQYFYECLVFVFRPRSKKTMRQNPFKSMPAFIDYQKDRCPEVHFCAIVFSREFSFDFFLELQFLQEETEIVWCCFPYSCCFEFAVEQVEWVFQVSCDAPTCPLLIIWWSLRPATRKTDVATKKRSHHNPGLKPVTNFLSLSPAPPPKKLWTPCNEQKRCVLVWDWRRGCP